MPRRLIAGLLLASLTLSVGFWLKWRILSPLDPVEWYHQSTDQFAYTDIIGIYLERDVASHPIPYVQMSLEYPPVAGIVMYLASFATGPQGFLVANYIVLALAGLGTVWALNLLRPDARLWVFAATPPLALYAGLNWDLLAIFFSFASLAFFQRGRDGWSAALLALGVWAKLFPLLLIPALVLQRTRERNWRSLAVMGLAFGLVSLAANLPFALLSYSGWRRFYDFHAQRGADGGSFWSNFDHLPVALVNDLSLAVVIVGLVVICTAGVRNHRPVAEQWLAILALFVVANKVSSPQYHLWLIPFLALFPPPWWLLVIFLGVDLAYYASSFQILFLTWGGQSPVADVIWATAQPIAAARLLALLAMFLWAARRIIRPIRSLIVVI